MPPGYTPLLSTGPLCSMPPVFPTSDPAGAATTRNPSVHHVGATAGLVLSPSLEPIPQRLVQRILSGRFLEMRELLADNIALHDQLEAVHLQINIAAVPAALRSRQREVPSLASWVYCFTAYVAVRCPDNFTRDLLAYCRIVIREALRNGGTGWQEYDRNFRRLAESDPTLRWNTLRADLHASTILNTGQRPGGITFCSLCRGADHSSSQCALAAIQPPTLLPPAPAGQTARDPVTARQPRPQRRPTRICSSWNSGACIYPGSCGYRHVCFTCQLSHRARDCPDTPSDSPFKRGKQAATASTMAAR